MSSPGAFLVRSALCLWGGAWRAGLSGPSAESPQPFSCCMLLGTFLLLLHPHFLSMGRAGGETAVFVVLPGRGPREGASAHLKSSCPDRLGPGPAALLCCYCAPGAGQPFVFLIFKLFILYWGTADEQCCDSFRWTAKGLSLHTHVSVVFQTPLPSRLPPNIEQSSVCCVIVLIDCPLWM